MPQSATANILTVLDTDFKGIIEEWLGTQVKEGVKRSDLFSDAESRNQNRELLKAFSKGVRDGVTGEDFDFDDTQWDDLRAVLTDSLMHSVNLFARLLVPARCSYKYWHGNEHVCL